MLEATGGNLNDLQEGISNYLDGLEDLVVQNPSENSARGDTCVFSCSSTCLGSFQSSNRNNNLITGANVLVAIFAERDSFAVTFLNQADITRYDAVN